VKTTSGASKFHKSFNTGNQLQDISEDGPSEIEGQNQSDVQKLESLFLKIMSKDNNESPTSQKVPDAYTIALSLFKKVQTQYGIDKVKLVKNLLDSMNNEGTSGKKIL